MRAQVVSVCECVQCRVFVSPTLHAQGVVRADKTRKAELEIMQLVLKTVRDDKKEVR